MIVEAITAGFKAVSSFFGFSTQRSAENNTPDVQKGAVAVEDQKAQDAANKAIADRNTEEIRKDLSDL